MLPLNDLFTPYYYDTINQDIEERPDMSIALGLIGKDGMVVATDSKQTEYNYAIKVRKLYELTSYIGITTVGYHGKYLRFLLNLCKEYIPHNAILSHTLADEFASLVKNNVAKYFTKNQLEILRQHQSMDFILFGYDAEYKAKIVGVEARTQTPFAPLELTPYYCGGVNNVGIYLIKKFGIDTKLTTQELPCSFLKKLAVMIIMETIVFSDMVSEPIQMAVIDETGYHDNCGEVDKIKANLDYRHKWIYDYLDKERG